MNNTKSIDIANWTEKSEELLCKVEKVFKKIDYPTDGIPKDVYDDAKPISIVFVGQFSAGKSSIIKALTGIKDIVIGSGIQTKETHVYEWNGIQFIDTPGIHTGIRPDHDEITYDAIAKADMLVYVVTQELFDDNIGQNFRRLLIDENKAGEMILVVNKMEDIGNTVTNREIKRNDLLKVTEPYTPEELRTVFIDAETYLDSLTEPDQEIAEESRLRSNYDELVHTVNRFVKDNEISSRLTTVLYRVFSLLQNAISENHLTTGDADIDMIEEHSLRERRIISEIAWRVETSVKSIYEEAASEIRAKGYELANTIQDCASEEEANEKFKAACLAVDQISEDCVNAITKKISDLTEEGRSNLDDFYKSNFSSNLQFRLEQRNNSGNSIIKRFLKTELIAQGSSKIIASTEGTNAMANGLKAFSGSSAHEWVLNIGHYFGHSFKPWEAIKWAKNVNTFGKALGIFGAVFSFGMQAKEDIDNEKIQKEMRENRERIRAMFNDVARELGKYFSAALNSYVDDNFRKKIAEIDETIASIEEQKKGKTEAYNLLVQAQDDCRQLISDIHKEYSDAKTE